MFEPTRIVDLAHRVMAADPWHAASVRDLLEGVSAADAHAHPVPGAHSIWEIVLHLTGWATEVRHRIDGEEAGAPDAGDWPPVGRQTAARWRAARHALFASYQALGRSIGRLTDADLKRPVTDFRESPAGTGMSHYLTSHGAIHHAVYHAGQIAVLKRALDARRASRRRGSRTRVSRSR